MSPNTRGTPIRGVRVPDDLWIPAQTIADKLGHNLSEEIRAHLRRYVHKNRHILDE